MAVTRREVLEQLAASTDSESGTTTTAEALADTLEAEKRLVETHLEALEDCELARRRPDGRIRVTVTGEELLALGIDGPAIINSQSFDA